MANNYNRRSTDRRKGAAAGRRREDRMIATLASDVRELQRQLKVSSRRPAATSHDKEPRRAAVAGTSADVFVLASAKKAEGKTGHLAELVAFMSRRKSATRDAIKAMFAGLGVSPHDANWYIWHAWKRAGIIRTVKA